MRAKEFITEYIGDLYDWVSLAKKAIMTRIDNGEIPNDPDSIKAAAKQLALDMKDGVGDNIDISPENLADEVENEIFLSQMSPKAHLGGKVDYEQSPQIT